MHLAMLVMVANAPITL